MTIAFKNEPDIVPGSDGPAPSAPPASASMTGAGGGFSQTATPISMPTASKQLTNPNASVNSNPFPDANNPMASMMNMMQNSGGEMPDMAAMQQQMLSLMSSPDFMHQMQQQQTQLMSSPELMRQMQNMTSNPDTMRMMMDSNPMLQHMKQTNPQAVDMLDSQMRAMMDPDKLSGSGGMPGMVGVVPPVDTGPPAGGLEEEKGRKKNCACNIS